MDGEILFTDATRFKTIKGLVDADLTDRSPWFRRAEKNRIERYLRTNTEKPIYPGAPNLPDPVIKDLIRELKQSIGEMRNIETFHVTPTPIPTETFRRADFSFRSPDRRFLMRWIALDAAASSVPARAASSGIDSLRQSAI